MITDVTDAGDAEVVDGVANTESTVLLTTVILAGSFLAISLVVVNC